MELIKKYTTLRLGGPAKKLVHVATEEELVNAVKAADAAGEEVLIIGGGSNVLVGDEGFNGTVIRVKTKGNSYHVDACSGGMITVAAGEDWDGFVEWILIRDLPGLRRCQEFRELLVVHQFRTSVRMAMKFQK
jgi:UDP-N-acetylmuramate dehydrogenase